MVVPWFKKKKSASNGKDLGLIPGWRRPPGEGNGNPFLYSCLGDTIDRGACGLQSLGSQKVEYSWAQHIHFALRLDSYPSIETERQRCSLLGDHTSKGWLTGAWEKYFLAAKLARGWKKIYISKQQRKKPFPWCLYTKLTRHSQCETQLPFKAPVYCSCSHSSYCYCCCSSWQTAWGRR